MFGKEAFAEGLKQLGLTAQDRGDNRLSFPYSIEQGRFTGQLIQVGIDVPADFNVTCPTGPHISPRLIPINPNGGGNDRSAESPFGADWQYLSRPFGEQNQANAWARTKREVKTYIKHIKRILETL